MIRIPRRCGTMDQFRYTKYSLSIDGKRVPIMWKRLNEWKGSGVR